MNDLATVDEKAGAANDIVAKGFFHLQIEDENGEIVGDSGVVKNLVTLLGFQHICLRTGTALTGTQFSHLNVGEGAAPATNATSLPSEVSGTNNAVQRQVATASTLAGSKTLRFLGTMSSANSFVTAAGGETITNVGIFNHSSAASCVAGAAYTGSTVASNQNVNITYDLVFETA
jgi:hypothetical protein